MKNNLQKALYGFLAILFWLTVWECLALAINLPIIFPTVSEVFVSLGRLIITFSFCKTLFFSFFRITIGFSVGVILGILLALVCQNSKVAKHLFSPIMTVIRATPVASFIMVMWLIIGSDFVPSTITALMVLPVIWQNLTNAFSAIDKNLDEVCYAFEISGVKRLRILVFPTLLQFLVPGIITSAGLAWKSGIAAEIISYTSGSIGKEIFNAKNYLESAEMLAWTLVVIMLSLLFEFVISIFGKKVSKNATGAKENQ